MKKLALVLLTMSSTAAFSSIKKDGWELSDVYITGSSCPENLKSNLEVSTTKNPAGLPQIQLKVSFPAFQTQLSEGDFYASDTCNISVAIDKAPCRRVGVDRAVWTGFASLADKETFGAMDAKFYVNGNPSRSGSWQKEGPFRGGFEVTANRLGVYQPGFFLNADSILFLEGNRGFMKVNTFNNQAISWSCSCI
ncbi:DUF4360 domain-containing protein [Pseudobacteriovorax antillogorgiicola]|uniref:Uncharacterized protein n=1 Tax=Pseudobacteriovorax antillogorgiicola TaxID=1513793 RepID=A0A1Y6CL47_9BACT|nr:DUF4360 domain-containing protein [Pseudobacteriovorax antillogorgiicola]TCS45914.1 uncharacterized protein DUF4360 [Pseudobacteriovorax antillogorgiicola]SMF71071.1 protein of unknown function [Pseudobacteriovorax antillogorgiicola]